MSSIKISASSSFIELLQMFNRPDKKIVIISAPSHQHYLGKDLHIETDNSLFCSIPKSSGKKESKGLTQQAGIFVTCSNKTYIEVPKDSTKKSHHNNQVYDATDKIKK